MTNSKDHKVITLSKCKASISLCSAKIIFQAIIWFCTNYVKPFNIFMPRVLNILVLLKSKQSCKSRLRFFMSSLRTHQYVIYVTKAHNSATEKLQISKRNSEENYQWEKNKLISNVMYLTAQSSNERSEVIIKVYLVIEWLLQWPSKALVKSSRTLYSNS